MRCTIAAALFALTTVVSLVAQDAVRLRVEVYRNDTQLGAPTVSVSDGSSAAINIDGVGSVTVSATRLDAENTSLSLEVVSGDKTMRPGLVLRGHEPGVLKWQSSSGAESYELRFTTLQ